MKKVKVLQMQKLEQTETFLNSDEQGEIQFKAESDVQTQEDNCLQRFKQKYIEEQLPNSCLTVTLLLVLAYLILASLGILILPRFLRSTAQQKLNVLELEITQLKSQIQQYETSKDFLHKEMRSLEDELTSTHKLLQKYESETKPAQDQSINWMEEDALLPLNPLQLPPQPSPQQPQSNPVQPQKQQFEIQPNFWLFSIEEQKKNHLKKLKSDNNQYYAALSNFTAIVVTRTNYRDFLSDQGKDRITNVLKVLEERIKKNEKNNLKSNMQSIEKTLAMLSILYEKGGVIATESFTITETFDWIRSIKSNMHVNRGNFDATPQVVGFFSPYYSLSQEKLNKQIYPGMERVDRYAVLAPTLESYFVAARKGAQFINRIIDEMVAILKDPEVGKTEVQKNAKQYPGLQGKDIYFEYYLIAVKKVIISKQVELDSRYTKINDRHFAIDHYGIFSINCHYAPYKIKVFWKDSKPEKLIQNLAKYDIAQLYANVGNLRYIDFSTIPKQLNEYLEKLKQNQTANSNGVMKGSYIQKMYFPNATEPFIYDNKEQPFVNATAEPWSSLPKIIWVYWDKGLKNSKASTQLCVENLRRMGAMSGIVVNEINDTNLGSYLDEEILQKINYTLTNAKVKTYPQSKGDLYRLSLMTKYGGIYLDASFLAVENFDWLLNIGKYPSEFIFNRYGPLPKVLMFWHPHFGSPFDWTVDAQIHSKVQWHLSYENNFIAAQKGAQFIKEWLQLYLELLLKPYDQIVTIFKKCKMEDHKWINPTNQYLLAMDSAKCIIGRKQSQIKSSTNSSYKGACDYYKLWSMSGYLGQQKFRSNTNYDNPQSNDHTLFYRYPQQFSEGLVGKVRHVTKLYSVPNKQLNAFIGQHLDGDFRDQSHSQSIFMKYLFNKPYKLAFSEGEAILVDQTPSP